MNEIELLRYQIKGLEKTLLTICKDLNERINKLEEQADSLRAEMKR